VNAAIALAEAGIGPMETRPIVEVLGRWAYSEIVEGTLAADYDDLEGVEELRNQHRSAVPYEALRDAEKNLLAFLCAVVRPFPFAFYASAIRRFKVIQLTKDQLSQLLVMPQVDADELKGRFVSFGGFFVSTPPNSLKDCRNVIKPSGGYTLPADALTVGLHQQNHVLIDGYHRAVAYMRWAPADATIAAYVPHS
jgi:hypothetical protein